MILLYSYMDIVIIFVVDFLTLLHPGMVFRVHASIQLLLQVTRFMCFCENIVLLPISQMLKCFLLLCNIIAIYIALNMGLLRSKEQFVYLFILFLCMEDVTFLYVIYVYSLQLLASFPLCPAYFHTYVPCVLCVMHKWMSCCNSLRIYVH